MVIPQNIDLSIESSPLNEYNILCRVQKLSICKVKLDVTRVVLVFAVVSLVHHLAGRRPVAA